MLPTPSEMISPSVPNAVICTAPVASEIAPITFNPPLLSFNVNPPELENAPRLSKVLLLFIFTIFPAVPVRVPATITAPDS